MYLHGLKPCTDVANNLLEIDLRLEVSITCDGLQQKFQHAEYLTCDPLMPELISMQFSNGYHH